MRYSNASKKEKERKIDAEMKCIKNTASEMEKMPSSDAVF